MNKQNPFFQNLFHLVWSVVGILIIICALWHFLRMQTYHHDRMYFHKKYMMEKPVKPQMDWNRQGDVDIEMFQAPLDTMEQL